MKKSDEKLKRRKNNLSRIESYKKYQNFIKGFCCLNSNQKKEVQKNLDKNQVEFISSVVHCLLHQHLEIDNESKNKLKKYKKKLQILSDDKSIKRKQRILQTGGFLPVLFSILASSVIPSAINFVLKKISNQG